MNIQLRVDTKVYIDGYAVCRGEGERIHIWGKDGSYSLCMPDWPDMRPYPPSVHDRIKHIRSTAASGTYHRFGTIIPPAGEEQA